MQDIVCVWYVAARKRCVVIDGKVTNWSCMLSFKNNHLTFLCLPHHLWSFWQYSRSWSIILILINQQWHFNLQEMKNCVTFLSSLKNIASFSFVGVRNLKAVEGPFVFFHTNIWFISFLSDGKMCINNL